MSDAKQSGSTFGSAAYGGDNWSPRQDTHREEIGSIWADCGIDSEWRALKSVLLHCPGDELNAAADDPDALQMLGAIDIGQARAEHAALCEAYSNFGITVETVDPKPPWSPNLMFCADLVAMTPEGAILARPASTVRAGEERAVASRLAALGIPILATLTGNACFEGADLMWLDEHTAIIGRGLRTNDAAIEQIRRLLDGLGVELIAVDMPFGSMHFMGMLRIVDRDLAICWPRRTPHRCVEVLRELGYRVYFPEFEDNQDSYRAINFVTLGPRRILMVEGLSRFQSAFENRGIDCLTSPTDALSVAAGNVGCLTAVLAREMAG